MRGLQLTVLAGTIAALTVIAGSAFATVLGKDDTASCCRLLSQVAELALPAASPPAQRRLEVLGIVEKRWREAMAKAKQLEQKKRLGEAASALEKVLRDYPHAPWEKQTRTEIGRVWRRIQGPGGGL